MSVSPCAAPEVEFDPFGFPMVRVEEVESHVHWLPITKIQFETFLCHSSDARFDSPWYEELCRSNRRVSPRELQAENYWGAFLTGILPDEALAFAEWCGPSYRLPSLEEWLVAFRALRLAPLWQPDWQEIPNDRVRCLLTELGGIARESMSHPFDESPDGPQHASCLADQMFLRMGVLEWVAASEIASTWCGLGELHPGFGHHLSLLDKEIPVELHDPLKERHDSFGFRLFRQFDSEAPGTPTKADDQEER